jgi:hypothetical protein
MLRSIEGLEVGEEVRAAVRGGNAARLLGLLPTGA